MILLGGALSSFFVVQNSLAYDQHNTHPALTSEAVNFFNLNFPKNKITEKEKQLLIKGAVDEDILPRPMNHFYDPIYKRGWAGYRSSKLWARSSAQQQTSKGFLALNPFVTDKLNDSWPSDFSYERALLDYAKGNRERAFEAFGHVMHLLEDANVPEHTRNDTHADIGHNTGSPYESTMVKWNPNNFKVAENLYRSRQKPVLLNDLDQYFDVIAGYSNGYFFSEDTIFSEKYTQPVVDFWRYERVDNKITAFGYKNDKNGTFRLVKELDKPQTRNIVSDRLYSIDDENSILDGYWSRLSKDFVLHGAGALKMFLDQAEEVKKEYEKKVAERKDKSWLASIFGREVSGVEVVKGILEKVEKKESRLNLSEDPMLSLTEVETEAQPLLRSEAEPQLNPGSDLKIQEEIKVEPSKTKVQPLEQEENVGGGVPVLIPQKLVPVIFSGGGGGGNQTAQPTPTPTPIPEATPTPEPDPAIRKVVINEIAWMGTSASTNDEWIELHNTSSKSVDLTGWTLKAQDGTPDISLSPISIGAFGFYLLERTSDSTISDTAASQIYTGALSNTGEVLELRDAGGSLQDLVSKPTSGDWYAGSNTSKSSMERINPKTKGDEQTNWGTNNGTTKNGLDSGSAAINGTPKSKNSNYVTLAPGQTTNLALSSQTSLNKIYLTWTVPSDSDTASASLSYDIRYATKSFDTSDDWTNAKTLQGLTLYVDNFGTASTSFTIQDFNKTYYFVLKTKDNDNNYSDISNQVSDAISSAISSSGWPMSGLNQSHTLKASFLGPTSLATTVKWGIQLTSSPPINFGQPIVGPNGNIYFGTSNGTVSQLWARSSANAEVWTYNGTDGATIGTPAVLADNSIVFGYSSNGTNLTKLDASKTTQFENNLGQTSAITIGPNGTTYFTASADKILAIKPDGTQKWLTYQSGVAGFAPSILDDGKIYTMARVSGVPTFYSFDAGTGALLWTKTMSTNSPSCCGVSDISYDSTNDYLYAAADQYILKVDRNGSNLEQFVADRQVGWGYTTTMISQDINNLVFGLDFSINNPASQSAVYAVNKSTKEVAWKYAVESKINKQITIDSGGNSYFSTKNGVVYSLNQSGVLNWKYDFGPTTISTYPVIGEGVLYVSTDAANLVKFGE